VRILFLCHRVPFPPSSGAKIRAFHIIRHLADRHDVTIASVAHTAAEAEAAEPLEEYGRLMVETITPPAAWCRMLMRLPTPWSSSAAYFYSPQLARRIRSEAVRRRFDLIFVHCAFAAPYADGLPAAPRILDFCDMDSQKWLAYAKARVSPVALGYALEGVKLQRVERRLAAQFHLCTCATPAELDTLRSYGVRVRTEWFPNGVDTNYFSPATGDYIPDSIVFVGRMDYFPNAQCMIEFCRTTLPLLQAHRPRASLTIVGADPPPAVRALARLRGVTVTGGVPDVRPYVRQSAVAVAPLRIARGIQNKILETMAMGVPTVTSDLAARGIDAEPGRDFLVASTPHEWADAIARLLDDADYRRRFADAGRKRMVSHHQWAQSMAKLDRLIERVVH
jgi:sugar transferase (PEP-CTERM/EpsH1 system associated)